MIDFRVVHGHWLAEYRLYAERWPNGPPALESALGSRVFNGGSSAKLSIICSMLGHKLFVYDSFEGLEEMSPEEKKGSYDFSGDYAASEDVVRDNITRYGEIRVCSLHKGWFADTLAHTLAPCAVRVAYIDCDVAKGTREARQGIVPALVE